VVGPVVALSTIVTEPLTLPCTVGVNVSDMVQLRPADRTVPFWHGFVPVADIEKSPLGVTLTIEIEFVLEFFTLTNLGPRLLPSTTLLNPKFSGLKDRDETAPPVPEPPRPTICGL
jgi:hypothetical protein